MIGKNEIPREERDSVNHEENPKALKDKGMQDSFLNMNLTTHLRNAN